LGAITIEVTMHGVMIVENDKSKTVFEVAPYRMSLQVTYTMLPVFKAGSFD
jgi:hypothetical protein